MPNRYEIGAGRVDGGRLFEYPGDDNLLTFAQVAERVNALDLETDPNDRLSLTANFTHNGKETDLTVTAMPLQKGAEKAPLIIYLPRYGEESSKAKRLLNINVPLNWNIEGIDIFHSAANNQAIISSVTGSQFGYALPMRMLEERITEAHQNGQKVGLVGFSYGAHLISAYLSQQPQELPDAIVDVLGGSIRESTLHLLRVGKLDRRTIQALEINPDLLPRQDSLHPDLAERTAAVINLIDEMTLDQDNIWGNADRVIYVPGRHLSVQAENRALISNLAGQHLQELLAA
ncbi:MAG: hypothetical protein ACREHC_03130 [Candidatus Levyibacteriota bacterium]